jgi:arylsulfatase A-like enzyme
MVFASDHGEEFLEHGRMFHGQTVYGELTSVPLVFHRPGQVPAGAVIDETVENIDIMPTILELSHLPIPKAVEGKSLLPLLAAARDKAKGAGPAASLGELAAKYGWIPRAAVSEKASTTHGGGPPPRNTESYSIIFDGWRLINNKQRPPGMPEFELYEHPGDLLDLKNLATLHPDRVKQLSDKLEAWHREAVAGQLPKATSTKSMSKEELERLRSLGYIQ